MNPILILTSTAALLTAAPAPGAALAPQDALPAAQEAGPPGREPTPEAPSSVQTADTLTLPLLLASALETHPALGAAGARLDAAGASARAARGARLPAVALEGSLTRFQEPMIVAPLHGFDIRTPPEFDETLVQGRLGMRYTLFDGGARRARIRAADAGTLLADAAFADTEDVLVEQVVGAYTGVLAARAVLAAADAHVAALEGEFDRTRQGLEAGTVARVELARARAALEDARAARAAARAQTDLAERNLARLAGLDPAEVAGRPLADVPAPGAPERPAGEEAARGGSGGVGPLAAGAAAPDPPPPAEERALRAVEAAEARLSAERARLAPRIDLGAAVLNFGSAGGTNVREWQAGAQLSWPVFTGGARRAEIRRAEADLAAARADLERVRLELAAARDAARARLDEALARAEALEVSVESWSEVARIEALALEVGTGVQAEYLRAQAALFQARAHLARTRYDAVLARVALARAEGALSAEWIRRFLETDR